MKSTCKLLSRNVQNICFTFILGKEPAELLGNPRLDFLAVAADLYLFTVVPWIVQMQRRRERQIFSAYPVELEHTAQCLSRQSRRQNLLRILIIVY